MAIAKRKNKDETESFRARVRDAAGLWYRSEWKRHLSEAMIDEGKLVERKRLGESATDAPKVGPATVLAPGEDLLSKEAADLKSGKTTTVDDLWAVFQDANRTEVSDGWKISQDQMARDYISPVIGKKFVADVGIPDIGHVLTRMKKLGRGEQMRLHVYRLLYQIFDVAVSYYGMIKKSPVSAEYHKTKVPETESRFLKPEQSWALLEEARISDDRAVWVELLAGLRTEATVALTWPNVQWDLDQILICSAWKSKVKRLEDFPKGKKAEYVPLTPVLKEFLQECYGRDRDKTSFVCPGPRGGMLSVNTFRNRLEALCKRAGLPVVSSHILRHSCTEIFVNEGATQEDLRRLLNHKSGVTTLRYMHRSDSRLNAISARIKKPQLQLISGGGEKCTHESTHVGTSGRMPTQEAVGK